MEFQNKVVLVVGASSGIGRVLALQLAQQGACLAITARRKEALTSLADEITAGGGDCMALTADALDGDQASAVVRDVVAHYGCLDCIVLNAGGAPALDMRTMDAESVLQCMRLNYDVTVNYLFPALEQMKTQRSGFVVHTNSLAGFLGIPLQGPYSAAKGATRLLIDTCRLEFAEFGIKFLNVYPGFVATEATKDDGMPAPLEISEEKAATLMLNAMRKEKSDYLFPWYMGALVRLGTMLPGRLRDLILRGDVPKAAD